MFKNRLWDLLGVVFNLDDGAGGAGGGAGGAGDAGGGKGRMAALAGEAGAGDGGGAGGEGGAASAATGTAGAGTPYVPEGLDERFKGANDRETIDKLAGEIAGRPKAPAKAEEYTLTLSEKQTARFGDMKDDPVLPIVKSVAHAAGLTNDQFQNMFTGLYEGMLEKGLLDEGIDPQQYIEALAPKGGDPATRKAQAARRANDVLGNLNGLVTRQVLTKSEANLLQAVGDLPQGVIALEKVFKHFGVTGVQGGGQGAGGAYSWNQWDQDMKDERYDSQSPKFDMSYRQGIDAKMRTLGPRKRS